MRQAPFFTSIVRWILAVKEGLASASGSQIVWGSRREEQYRIVEDLEVTCFLSDLLK